MNKRIVLTVMLVSAVILPAALYAEDNASTKKITPIVTEDMNPRLKTLISMRAQDASLSEVLKVLADRSGMNFVTGEGVYKEKITIILTKTPVDEAIDLVVRAAGLAYEIIGNSVLIAEADKLKGEVGQQGYVIALKYANADEVAGMLSDLTKFVKVDKGGNRLICFTSPRVINEIERIVKSIDHPHILVSLDARIIEVSQDKMKQYGIAWGSMSPVIGGLSHPATKLTKGYSTEKWELNPLEFDVKLDLMIQNNDAKILMNSKLTTTNNREASLHIGEVVPYTIQSYNMGGMGGGANQQIQKENVGVLLTMTPHVNEDNQVTLQLEPEISNIVAFIGPNKDMPKTRVRTAKTTVRVKDGETILIAGLLSEEASIVLSKIPILGDIPLLGKLFQNTHESMIKKNLILEITPKILRDSTHAASADPQSLPESVQEASQGTEINIVPVPSKP